MCLSLAALPGISVADSQFHPGALHVTNGEMVDTVLGLNQDELLNAKASTIEGVHDEHYGGDDNSQLRGITSQVGNQHSFDPRQHVPHRTKTINSRQPETSAQSQV